MIDASGLDRGLFFDSGWLVSVQGDTIADSAPLDPSAIGDGLLNYGMLTFPDSQIVDETGGAVWNEGVMTVRNSSILRNTADYGGGFTSAGGSLTLIDSLVA